MINKNLGKHSHELSGYPPSSSDKNNEIFHDMLKQVFRNRISALEIEVAELQANTLAKDKEMKTLKDKLLA